MLGLVHTPALLFPWQLPRASRAFSRQDLQVQPLAAEPPLSAPERNRPCASRRARCCIGCRGGREEQRLPWGTGVLFWCLSVAMGCGGDGSHSWICARIGAITSPRP